jgi:hypothetical protein
MASDIVAANALRKAAICGCHHYYFEAKDLGRSFNLRTVPNRQVTGAMAGGLLPPWLHR